MPNFEIGHDHQIFSLMRSTIAMESEEVNRYS